MNGDCVICFQSTIGTKRHCEECLTKKRESYSANKKTIIVTSFPRFLEMWNQNENTTLPKQQNKKITTNTQFSLNPKQQHQTKPKQQNKKIDLKD